MTLDAILDLKLGDFSVKAILSAIVLSLLCLLIIRIITHLLKKLLTRSPMDERIRRYTIQGTKALLYLLAFFIVIESLDVKTTSLVALLSVGGLALSLALQDMLGNVAGGLLILTSRPFAVGDFIEASGVSGTVAEIALNCTRLDTPDGRRVLLPNRALSGNQLINYSTLGRRRIEHRISASYDAPLEAVTVALLHAAAATKGILPDPAPAAQVESYGESGIQYSIRCWAESGDYWVVYYALLANLKSALDSAGVEMTYNHLNVHLK